MYVYALQKFSRSCADSDSLPKSLSGNFPNSSTRILLSEMGLAPGDEHLACRIEGMVWVKPDL